MSLLYFFLGSNLEKCGKFWKNGRFSPADKAGLGKYCTGGYDRIGVYRVNTPITYYTFNTCIQHKSMEGT